MATSCVVSRYRSHRLLNRRRANVSIQSAHFATRSLPTNLLAKFYQMCRDHRILPKRPMSRGESFATQRTDPVRVLQRFGLATSPLYQPSAIGADQIRTGDQPEGRKGPRAASSFVSSLAADRRPHSDSAAASPLGVTESQPLVWPNLASSSHPCALAYLIAGRISPSFNPVSAGAATVCHRIVPPSTGAGRPWVYWLQKLALGESSH
jgi:hypothetical protein